jgi:hypothetical protein
VLPPLVSSAQSTDPRTPEEKRELVREVADILGTVPHAE